MNLMIGERHLEESVNIRSIINIRSNHKYTIKEVSECTNVYIIPGIVCGKTMAWKSGLLANGKPGECV